MQKKKDFERNKSLGDVMESINEAKDEFRRRIKLSEKRNTKEQNTEERKKAEKADEERKNDYMKVVNKIIEERE